MQALIFFFASSIVISSEQTANVSLQPLFCNEVRILKADVTPPKLGYTTGTNITTFSIF